METVWREGEQEKVKRKFFCARKLSSSMHEKLWKFQLSTNISSLASFISFLSLAPSLVPRHILGEKLKRFAYLQWKFLASFVLLSTFTFAAAAHSHTLWSGYFSDPINLYQCKFIWKLLSALRSTAAVHFIGKRRKIFPLFLRRPNRKN